MKRRRIKQPTVSVKAAKPYETPNYFVMWMLGALPLLALSFLSAQLIISNLE